MRAFPLLLIISCGISSLAFAKTARLTDSTNVPVPKVEVMVRPYLLAQGTIVRSFGNVNATTTDKRCGKNTSPVLRTSIIQTGINLLAAIQGIHNSLQLRESDYHIIGALYMSNQVVSNSYASANWQVWCQPVTVA